MAYDWRNVVQSQLQGQPQLNTSSGMNALIPMNSPQQLRTGKNPNPKFPRARNWWEGVKEGGGNFFKGGKEFLFGQPGGVTQYSTLTPDQQSIIQYLMELSHEGLSNPYEGFDPIAQQARTQFSQQTVPSLAERFTSMGDNALSSGAFISQLGQAGAGLESDLAAQRAQYGQQNKQQMIQTLLSLLQPRSENVYNPRQSGALESLASIGLGNIGGIWDVRQKAKLLKNLEPNR